MTAKRFTYDSKTVSILKDGEFWLDGNVDTACNHSEICNELNALNDENEQLRHDATILIQSNQDYRKENEQLKQFKEDVFNKIDMHLRMLPTARDNEFDEDDGDPSLYVGAIYMLETLKKELEE